jgi:phosphatidylethanolamine-binding protein (PEBP) family uncharacterized protein
MNPRERGFILAMVFLASCFAVAAGCEAGSQRGVTMKLESQSTDFASGANIPKQFTCDAADISPALTWNDPPATAPSKS